MKFYSIAKCIVIPIIKLFYKIEVIGEEKVPMKEPLIFASNHKSNLDPILIGAFMPREVSYMAKKELFKNKLLGYILKNLNVFPVDRNKTGISTIKVALKILKSEKALGIFPEGTRIKGEELGKAKAGTAMLAIKGKAKVCPVSIIGNYKLFSKITLYIDDPISFEEYYKEKLTSSDYEILSQKVLDVIGENMNKLN
ncbi:lysophospholipid acyltransferase family protein [Tepidibacter thalassicus]|uniref:1-acyl-sn-glycerol-3-phosphate acyltransferase n=1 Tax=Tepidibacter thalassicus DSM 15285 TaxID=1123350 RepID=A0A1M5TH08_9FIRM|nr:lysophospholipid acyltransferase family protein [Tepidibacter thalassicus]SHH49940.1 1-acyl-sn-glycerol-3-phosphate acyltransferase [Tepidibacter thalassicus DSM 15285]